MDLPISRVSLLHVVTIVIGSFGLAFFWPSASERSTEVPIMALAVIAAMFIISVLKISMVRRRELHSAVYLELNKLRRVYHLAKNITGYEESARLWFTELHGHLAAYLMSFEKRAFVKYSEGNSLFRAFSYHVYAVPVLEDYRSKVLYQDMMRTAATVAESRQRIKDLLKGRITFNAWVVIFLLTASFVAAVLATLAEGFAARVIAGAEVASMLLVVNLLWHNDTLSEEGLDLTERYVRNLGKLELRRN